MGICRAIGWFECLLGFVTSLLIQFGIGSVLAETYDERLQVFIVLLYGVSFYLVFIWQYLAGRRKNRWTPAAQRRWRTVATVAGVILGLGLALNIIVFHLTKMGYF